MPVGAQKRVHGDDLGFLSLIAERFVGNRGEKLR